MYKNKISNTNMFLFVIFYLSFFVVVKLKKRPKSVYIYGVVSDT